MRPTKGFDISHIPSEGFNRFWTKIDKKGPLVVRSRCWLWDGYAANGVPCWLPPKAYTNGRLRTLTVAQILFALSHDGVLPAGTVFTRTCETPLCVRHWQPGTQQEAAQRITLARERRTKPVDEIRSLRKQGVSCAELAKRFKDCGLSHETIRQIALNRQAVDPKYKPRKPGDRRVEHPELVRFKPEAIKAIREARKAGYKWRDICEVAGSPFTTVWEAVNGPSCKQRRAA